MEYSGNKVAKTRQEVVGRQWNVELVITTSKVLVMKVNEKVQKKEMKLLEGDGV